MALKVSLFGKFRCRRRRIPARFDWKLAAITTPSDPFEFIRNRLPWPITITV
jgi:hypothetical protein